MLADLNDLAKQAVTGKSGRGGRRPGAGRPRKDGTKAISTPQIDMELRTAEEILANGVPPPMLADLDGEDAVDNPLDAGGVALTIPANPAALFAGAKARKEAALAARAELEFRVRAGMYVPRAAVREANATAYQAVAQALRSIPDNLERKLGLPPEVTEAVGLLIDSAMGALADDLEKINTQTYESAIKD